MKNGPGKNTLLIGICRAWNVVESACEGDSQKKIIVVIKLVSVLIIFLRYISVRNIIQVIEEGLSHAKLSRHVILWIENIFYSSPKGNGQLNIAILDSL